MSTTTGVATQDRPETDGKDNLLKAAKALAELQGHKGDVGNKNLTNKKAKNLMVMGIARFCRFHKKTRNQVRQARARRELPNWLSRTIKKKQTKVGQN